MCRKQSDPSLAAVFAKKIYLFFIIMLDKLNICQAPCFFVLFCFLRWGWERTPNLFRFAVAGSTPEKHKVDLFTLTML